MAFGDFVGDTFDRANALWVSVVRTLAPVAAGYIISFLAGIGVAAPDGSENNLTALITAGLIAVWYIVARVLENQGIQRGISWLADIGGYMLGVPNAPEYITEKKQDGEPEGP